MLSLPLKSYAELFADQALSCRLPEGITVTGACADSRAVQPGWLFCALPGRKSDGSAFVEAAIASGASAVVAERDLAVPSDVGLIVVDDAHEAAGRIAAKAYGNPASYLTNLGVTGTNGKTTVAFLLRSILREAGRIPGMIGTVEYDLVGDIEPAERTTPTAFDLQRLLRRAVDRGAQSLVMEVSSHALVQRRLGDVRFDGAIFTNLTGDHLDYHGSLENYYQAKKTLFTDYMAPGATAVVNTDDPIGARLISELRSASVTQRLVTVGEYGSPRSLIENVNLGHSSCSFTLSSEAEETVFKSPLIGRHNVCNLAVAAVMGRELGIPVSSISQALARCSGAPGRLQAIPSFRGFTGYVDYAHTDDALRNVLEALRELSPHELTVVFGCGGDRDRTKRPRMGRIAAAFADRVYITSDNPRSEDPEAIIDEILVGIPKGVDVEIIPDRAEAIRTAVNSATEGDIILIAGKGHENYQEIKGERFPFDDVQVLTAAIRDH